MIIRTRRGSRTFRSPTAGATAGMSIRRNPAARVRRPRPPPPTVRPTDARGASGATAVARSLSSMKTFALILLLCVSALCAAPSCAAGSETDQAIALAQHRAQRQANSPNALYRLGDAYIRKARESGDTSYFKLADEALRKSLELNPQQSSVLRHLAYVLSLQHDFAQAAATAAKAVELNSADSDAYGILGDAYLETGQYVLAQEAYAKMIEISGDLASFSRRSGLKSLRGDPQGAIEDLQRAIDAGKASDQPRESIAWAQFQLGMEHLAAAHWKMAEDQFQAALTTYPGYYRAYAGLAHVRAGQKRYQDAIAYYQKALAVVPLPDYASALGDIYRKTGQRALAGKQYALVEYIGRLSAFNQIIYNRELAYFYADHDIKLPESLELTRNEIEGRKDVYGYDALAWALYKNGHVEEAQTAIASALELGTKDARLLFHAGMISHRVGENDKAEAYLQQALALNPSFHVLQADEARKTLRKLQAKSSARRDVAKRPTESAQ